MQVDLQTTLLDLVGREMAERTSQVERLNALAALAMMRDEAAVTRLVEIAEGDRDPEVRFRAIEILAERGHPSAGRWVAESLSSARSELRRKAAEMIATTGRTIDDSSLEGLGRLATDDPDRAVRGAAQNALSKRLGESPGAARAYATAWLDEQDPILRAVLHPERRAAEEVEWTPIQSAAKTLASWLGTAGSDKNDSERPAKDGAQLAKDWALLGGLRRRGIQPDLTGIGTWRRLVLARRAPSRARPVGLLTIGRAFLIGAIATALVFVLASSTLGHATDLAQAQDLYYFLAATFLAAFHVWVFGRVSRPAATSPDRWAAIVPELLVALLGGGLLALGVVGSAVGFQLMISSGDGGPDLEPALGVVVLSALALGLARFAGLASYGLFHDPGRRRLCSLLAAGLAGLAVLLMGAASLSQYMGVDASALIATFALYAAPSLVSSCWAWSDIDASLEDRRPTDTRILRGLCFLLVSVLGALLLLVEIRAIAGSFGDQSEFNSAARLERTAESAPDPYYVPLGETFRLSVPYPEPISIKAIDDSNRDIVLEFGKEGEDPRPTDDSEMYPETLSNQRLDPGDYNIRITLAEFNTDRPLTSTVAIRMNDLVAHELIRIGQTMQIVDPAVDLYSAGSIRLEVSGGLPETTVRTLTEFDEQVKKLKELPGPPKGDGGVSSSRQQSSPAKPAEHQARLLVAAEDLAGEGQSRESAPHIAKGSLLYQSDQELLLVRGRARGLAEITLDQAKLLAVPDDAGELLASAAIVARYVAGPAAAPYKDTDAGRLLAADYRDLALRLLDGKPPPLSPGVYAVTAKMLSTQGVGGLFQIRRRMGAPVEGKVDARLLLGWLPEELEMAPCYRLDAPALVALGSDVDEALRSMPEALRRMAPGIDRQTEPVHRLGAKDDDSAGDCLEWDLKPSPDTLRAAVGAYLAEFSIDPHNSEEPEIFRHYFVVVDEEQYPQHNYIPPGTIVRGLDWAPDESPYFDIVLGFSKCEQTCYIRSDALSYLGPELTPGMQVLPEAFRADWTEDQRSRYGEAQWIDRVAELTGTASAAPMPVGVPMPEAAPPSGNSVWAQLVRRKGAWVDDLDLHAAEPPDTFRHYFIVADDDSEVSSGTIVRGQVWDSDDEPGFEFIYGWRSGDDISWRYIHANRLTYLGPEFQARWFRLALLGRMSSAGFADRELSDGFVDAICGTEDHSAALCESDDAKGG